MQARMNNPAMIVPEAMPALLALAAAVGKSGVPRRTLDPVHLRASLINGRAVCLDMHARCAKKAGETHEQLFNVRCVAGRALLYGCRARRTDPDRGCDAAQRSVRSSAGRDLAGRRPALRRTGARLAGPLDRSGQRVEPRSIEQGRFSGVSDDIKRLLGRQAATFSLFLSRQMKTPTGDALEA
jgi:AhpD family alkylhydroperoxidase